MSEGDTVDSLRNLGAESAGHNGQRGLPAEVRFDRRELSLILNLFGRMVAQGEWRDYAIDFLKDRAVFSVFRRSSEMPLYRIEKNPSLRNRQGAYAVVATTGLIVKRGPDLERVLAAIDKRLKIVV
jgi:hypothetical protein